MQSKKRNFYFIFCFQSIIFLYSFTDAQRQSVLRTALLGLAYVHSQGIIHCDVKTKNIFVTEQMTGVLGDFDVSHDVSTRATLASAATKLSITGATWDCKKNRKISFF